MKYLAVALAAVSALAATASRTPLRNSLIAMEKVFDRDLMTRASATDALTLTGNTRGIYLQGYGAVFTAEVNLFGTAVQSPFHSGFTEKQKIEIRQKKSERIPILKQQMRRALVSNAGSLDTVPLDEQVVFGVSIFYFRWEHTEGLPTQIVMRAPRSLLVEAAKGKSAELDAALDVQEY